MGKKDICKCFALIVCAVLAVFVIVNLTLTPPKPPNLLNTNENKKINLELTQQFNQHKDLSPIAVQVYKFLVPRDETLPIIDANILVYSSSELSDMFKLYKISDMPSAMMSIFRGNIIKLHIKDALLYTLNENQSAVINALNLGQSYIMVVPIVGQSRILGFYTLIYPSDVKITENYLSFLSGITDIIKGEL